MIATTLLLLFPPAASPDRGPGSPQGAAPSPVEVRQGGREEFKRRFAEAREDYEALWKLVDWCEANGLGRERKRALLEVIRLEPEDAKARELLGHVRVGDRWFTSERQARAFQKKEAAKREKAAAAEAREKGWVRWNDRWVDPAHVPLIERGLVRDEDGEWLTPEEVARREAGWRRQDLEWIAPEEESNILAGRWKCDGRWLSTEAADEYHAEVPQPWRIPTDHFHLWTTLPRELARRAVSEVDDAYGDLVRIYGVEPAVKPVVLVLRSLRQYSGFAKGKYGGGLRGYDLRGLSSVHGAFFAEGWLDRGTRSYRGAGVGGWDFGSEVGARFGRLFARHAAGLSFAEAIDPSPETLAAHFDAAPPAEFPVEAFWAEKKVPAWFRYGAASYVERYFTDSFIGPGGDPRWTIKWAVENLLRRGGLDELETVLAFELNPKREHESEKLLSEAGLLVAFVVDGGVPAVQAAHTRVREALQAARRDPKQHKQVLTAFERLEREILRNEEALRAFAGIE